MTRVRYNNQSGTTGASISPSTTILTFAAGTRLRHHHTTRTSSRVTLDPNTTNVEILHIIGYTAASIAASVDGPRRIRGTGPRSPTTTGPTGSTPPPSRT